jgi:hypothetical protein
MSRFSGETPFTEQPHQDEDENGRERFEVHSSDPITLENFDKLDKIVLTIEEELGITSGNFYAFYKGSGDIGDTDLELSRYEGPDGLRKLDINSYLDGLLVSSIAIKNNVGTPANCGAIAGLMYTNFYDKQTRAPIHQSVMPVVNRIVERNIERIEERAKKQLFTKERHIPPTD